MSDSSPPLVIAIAGGGTVGGGVLRLLHAHHQHIAERCGRRIVVAAVGVRDVEKARARFAAANHPQDAELLTNGWQSIAQHPQAELVIELMGGEDEARQCIMQSLQNGKSVITANKALLAKHGDEIFAAANHVGKSVAYEAAIAGCVPVVKTLREALAADAVHSVTGIINGTCNYILSAMSRDGLSFADALASAQKLGYAEAEPMLDIDGWDAAHKIALIARLAFNVRPDMESFPVAGLRDFDLRDIRHAEQLGFAVKLLAQARRTANHIELSVQPTLIPATHPLAAISGATNAVLVHSAFAGETMYSGAGAGAEATAIAVAADIIDSARQNGALSAMDNGVPPQIAAAAHFRAPHYIRLCAIDRPGVLAAVAAALAEDNISIEAIHQNETNPGQKVDIIMLLHDTAQGQLRSAVQRIHGLDAIDDNIVVIPIQRFPTAQNPNA